VGLGRSIRAPLAPIGKKKRRREEGIKEGVFIDGTGPYEYVI
jgi:hypothetical protein